MNQLKMVNKKQKVIVSTDIGSDIDDALSLLVMFNSGINLQGIYTTNAKKLHFRSYIAKHMVNLRRKNFFETINPFVKNTTIAQGESNPLNNIIEPYWFHEDSFIDDSFIDEEASRVEIDIQYKKLEEVGIISNGLEDLANKLEKERYVIFSLAPLTNLARIIQDYPDSAKNIERLYIMGGSLENNLEHNIRFDPIAAEITFNSNVPITIIPQELCRKYRLPINTLNQLKKSKIGEYVRKMAIGFTAAKTAFTSYSLLLKIEGDIKPSFFNKQNFKKGEKKFKTRMIMEDLLTNLNDTYYGAFEADKYFIQYNSLIKNLREINSDYPEGKELANILEENIPKSISVADIYVPYCFLYPEKLKIKKGRLIGGSSFGSSMFVEGDKHDFVIDLDYNHFEKFLKKYLY